MEIPRTLLYINMTPTKTLIPSDTLNLAFLPGADLARLGFRMENANFAPLGLMKIPRPLLYTNMTLTK